MRDWIKNIFNTDEEPATEEWRNENSIYQFISNNIDTTGKLKESAEELPDEKNGENDLRFAAGLSDTLFNNSESEETTAQINELSTIIKRFAQYGDKKSDLKIYELIAANENIVSLIDPVLEEMGKLGVPIEPYLFPYAQDLSFKATNRNAVKFGIAILGVCQRESVLDEIKTLGLHDEFTLYTTIAIINLSDDPEGDLWELAKKVNGWGKIQAVDRLASMVTLPAIKDWLLLEGYKNDIMYEYLAYTCAVHGELDEKLSLPKIDRALYVAAGEIIEALISGGPAEDISNYESASITIEQYARHSQEHATEVGDYIVLSSIFNLLQDIQDDMTDHAENGWTQDILSNCLIDISSILHRVDWEEKTWAALNSTDNTTYWSGKQAARLLGLDVWDVYWKKLQASPHEGSLWYDVINEYTDIHTDEIIDLAIKTIPLEELATGPEDLLGLGTNFTKFQGLDFILPFLERYPAKGEPILLATLNSKVTRHRNFSLRVLSKWGKENWSPAIAAAFEKLKGLEPNQDTKSNIEKLERGEALD
ncbi:hypothetical protein GFS24_05450 [Chitinophaga sp. SYP-B3965]|uniref:hypothetical protein n=1 Tax=Chitinophaga sp. SYP-B3965 TaxID=2663120 RepID=UPI001299B030|nr:hypothetical protein [Chitinophaga sp. SYP-B3965]MRG44547.1 hypothetical protein [Chitinophaga sp. SYP-B3965]